MKDKNNHGFENALNGWLSIDGEFVKCPHGEHNKKAKEIEKEKNINMIWSDRDGIVHGERLLELKGWIKFVCFDWGCDGKNSHVFFPQVFGFKGEISEKQLIWMENNYNIMSTKQEADIIKMIKMIK